MPEKAATIGFYVHISEDELKLLNVNLRATSQLKRSH
jgi:hypothetical protein